MRSRRWRTAAANLRHSVSLASRLLPGDGRGPSMLVFFVSSRCEGQCRHCFDWQRRGPEVEARDLRLDEIESIARRLPPQYFMIVTGGEPFLRDDIREVVLAFAANARPRVLAIPTSGGRPDFVVEKVGQILRDLPDGVFLSVNVSIDGVGELHNGIRGVEGLFSRADKTLRGLKALSASVPNLGVGAVTVVSQYNQDHLQEVMDYVLDDVGLSVWAPFLVRGTPRDASSSQVDIQRYAEIARKLERRIRSGDYAGYSGFVGARINSAKNVVRRRIIERTVREQRRILPCTAGRLAAVVYADGSVYPCELRQETMGNLREFDYDLSRLWKSPRAREVRGLVRRANCFCTHENFMNMGIAFNPRWWPELAKWTLLLGASS